MTAREVAHMTLSEELMERARSYEQSSPSAQHTADLLRRAALRIDRLSSTASPLDLVEVGDADILIKALKAYRAETFEEENAIGYYVQKRQKVAADKEDAA